MHLILMSEETKNSIISFIVFLIYRYTNTIVETSPNEKVNSFIQIGMAIIIWYGIIKIFLQVMSKLLFGKTLNWNIGLLDLLFSKIKVNVIQRTVLETDEETLKKAEQITKTVKKLRTRRCNRLFKKLRVNAKTNSALATVGIFAITAGGYFFGDSIPFINELLTNDQWSTLLAAEIIGGSVLLIPGILGKGYQTEEEFFKMMQERKAKKQAKKERKASPEIRAEKLMKKMGISKEKALEIAKEQIMQEKKLQLEKQKAKEQKEIEALAKKLGISVEKAKSVYEEQKAK